MGDEYCKKCKSKLTTCAKCQGKGVVYEGDFIFGYSEKPCPVCKGTGKICPKHGNDWG